MWSDRQDATVLEFQYSLDALTAGTVTPYLYAIEMWSSYVVRINEKVVNLRDQSLHHRRELQVRDMV